MTSLGVLEELAPRLSTGAQDCTAERFHGWRGAWTKRRHCGKVTPKDANDTMSFCDHCQGQRFDRAQVLRVLRDTRRRLRDSHNSKAAEHALTLAIDSVRRLEIPHFDTDDEDLSEASIH